MQLQLYAFSPHPSTPSQVNPPPSPLSTLPLGFVHVSFIVVELVILKLQKKGNSRPKMALPVNSTKHLNIYTNSL